MKALKSLDGRFERDLRRRRRKSIPGRKRLLRALLLQILYTVRSERMLMEQLEYNLLFRWFVGLSANEPSAPKYSQDRTGCWRAVAEEFFFLVSIRRGRSGLLSDGPLHRRWHPDRSVGRSEELPDEERRQGRWKLPHRRIPAVIRRSTFTKRSVGTKRISR